MSYKEEVDRISQQRLKLQDELNRLVAEFKSVYQLGAVFISVTKENQIEVTGVAMCAGELKEDFYVDEGFV